MSRLQIDLTAQSADISSHILSAIPNAIINVYARNTDGTAGSAASVFSAASGGSTLTQPLTTDAQGRIPGWLDPGDYLVQISALGFTTQTLSYTVPGTGGGGLTIDGLSDYTQGSNNTVPSATYTPILMDASASWVDTINGTITSTGVYIIGLSVAPIGSVTGWMGWGNYVTSGNESLDALALTGFNPSIAVTIALTSTDLPFNPSWAVKTSASSIHALAFAYRLVH